MSTNNYKLSQDEKTIVGFMLSEIEEMMESNHYQRDFFESIKDQFVEKEWLSDKQIASLKGLYERVTS